MQVQPYVFFDGRCDEALEFYRKAIGAQVTMLMRFKDAPPGDGPGPANGDKVMHANVRIGDSTILASDGDCKGDPRFQGFSLSLTVSSGAEAQRIFTALSDGGQVRMPMARTFFSSHFGMLTDRFGVAWMVYVA